MLKLIISTFIFIFLGITGYNLIRSTSENSFNIEKGLWVEISSDKQNYTFGTSPILIEKVPDKDLILFSIAEENRSNKLLQLVRGENNSLLPLSLSPMFECQASSVMEYEKLKLNISCKDKSNKIVLFGNSGHSLFSSVPDKVSQENITDPPLALVAKVEQLNKKIHSIKKQTRELLEKTKSIGEAGSLDNSGTSMETTKPISDYENNPDLINNDLEQNQQKLDAIENDRKEIVRISNMGSDINLASRLNKIEWNILLKKWKKSPVAQFPELSTSTSKPKDSIQTDQPNHPDDKTVNQETTDPGNGKTEGTNNSWWKEF